MSRGYHYKQPRISDQEYKERLARSFHKINWLAERGWEPHYYQTLFLTDRNKEGRMTRYRHLVAGRRGGKTEVAAAECAYYLQHPWAWWYDFRGKENCNDPLWMWEVSKSYKLGRPALLKFRQILPKLGLEYGKDYTENKGDKFFEFGDSMIEFKSAEDPESLRGAGLHLMWMDEAAFIQTSAAWNVTSPSLSDNLGGLITTTTPKGKNWLFEEFFKGKALEDDDQARIEYTSLHNPYWPESEWHKEKKKMHPMLFKQEYMAAFDSMAGVELHGDWLHYYGDDEEYDAPDVGKLDKYIGVDPAISQSGRADRFVISLVGVEKDRSRAYLLEQWAGRLPFPEQVSLINEWYIKYRPQFVGVESVAYQAALVQQLERLPNFAPILPVFARGKKEERIIAMAPFFKIGKVLIKRGHQDFIDEWISFDPENKANKDDTLDSVEIALRTAGALLESPKYDDVLAPDPYDIKSLANRMYPRANNDGHHDFSMGADW